ncbi:MAG: hypothetical protein AB7P76_02640 [Candidatus Melainabacteria bacterium]
MFPAELQNPPVFGQKRYSRPLRMLAAAGALSACSSAGSHVTHNNPAIVADVQPVTVDPTLSCQTVGIPNPMVYRGDQYFAAAASGEDWARILNGQSLDLRVNLPGTAGRFAPADFDGTLPDQNPLDAFYSGGESNLVSQDGIEVVHHQPMAVDCFDFEKPPKSGPPGFFRPAQSGTVGEVTLNGNRYVGIIHTVHQEPSELWEGEVARTDEALPSQTLQRVRDLYALPQAELIQGYQLQDGLPAVGLTPDQITDLSTLTPADVAEMNDLADQAPDGSVTLVTAERPLSVDQQVFIPMARVGQPALPLADLKAAYLADRRTVLDAMQQAGDNREMLQQIFETTREDLRLDDQFHVTGISYEGGSGGGRLTLPGGFTFEDGAAHLQNLGLTYVTPELLKTANPDLQQQFDRYGTDWFSLVVPPPPAVDAPTDWHMMVPGAPVNNLNDCMESVQAAGEAMGYPQIDSRSACVLAADAAGPGAETADVRVDLDALSETNNQLIQSFTRRIEPAPLFEKKKQPTEIVSAASNDRECVPNNRVGVVFCAISKAGYFIADRIKNLFDLIGWGIEHYKLVLAGLILAVVALAKAGGNHIRYSFGSKQAEYGKVEEIIKSGRLQLFTSGQWINIFYPPRFIFFENGQILYQRAPGPLAKYYDQENITVDDFIHHHQSGNQGLSGFVTGSSWRTRSSRGEDVTLDNLSDSGHERLLAKQTELRLRREATAQQIQKDSEPEVPPGSTNVKGPSTTQPEADALRQEIIDSFKRNVVEAPNLGRTHDKYEALILDGLADLDRLPEGDPAFDEIRHRLDFGGYAMPGQVLDSILEAMEEASPRLRDPGDLLKTGDPVPVEVINAGLREFGFKIRPDSLDITGPLDETTLPYVQALIREFQSGAGTTSPTNPQVQAVEEAYANFQEALRKSGYTYPQE